MDRYVYGFDEGATVNSDDALYIEIGEELAGTVLSGGVMIVAGMNAEAVSTTVSRGGDLQISSGGAAAYTLLYGTEEVAGQDGSGTVEAGGVLSVGSGGYVTFVTVDSGGALNIASSGAVGYATVSSGASLTIASGGIFFAGNVLGGSITVSGSESSATVSSGELDVASGGSVSATTVMSGGQLTISAGGSGLGDILHGGRETVSGKEVSALIDSGANSALRTAVLPPARTLQAPAS